MISDIYRTANLLIHQHSRNAEREAALRAVLMHACGDHKGLLLWLRIGRAIEAL